MTPPRRNSNLVLVHHRKTGELEVRRAGEFSTIPNTPSTPLPRHLHYANEDRRRVCRCSHSLRHKKSSPVASESKHLAINLTRYLDHRKLEACSIADFRASEIQQQTEWASKGILADKFHYATRQKDVVCRCTKPNNHGRGTVRNPDIVELCAQFFRKNIKKMTCTKNQWRGIDFPSHEGSSSDSDSIKYDSKSPHDLLRERERLSYDAAPSTPHTDMTHLCSGPNGESDMPEQVWKTARPSMWSARRGSATSCSTALGTAASPKFPVDSELGLSGNGRPILLTSPQRASVATVWSNIQRDAGGQGPEYLSDKLEWPLTDAAGSVKPALRVDIPKRALVELRDSMFASLHPKTMPQPSATHRVELPTHHILMEVRPRKLQGYVELSGSVPRPAHLHSATLRELEGKELRASPNQPR